MADANILNALMAQQNRKSEGWSNLGESLSNLGGTVGEISKEQKLKKAGLMLAELGGANTKNLNAVFKAVGMNDEEKKEFLVTLGTFEKVKESFDRNAPISDKMRAMGNEMGLPIDENTTNSSFLEMLKYAPQPKEPKLRTVVRDGEYVTEEETVGPIDGIPAQYAPESKEGSDSLTGDVGQFYQIHGRPPASDEEFNNWLKNRTLAMTQNKDFAPETEQWRNPNKPGDIIEVNVRNEQEKREARDRGYVPIGPQSKGYLSETGKLGAQTEGEIISSSKKARAMLTQFNSLERLMDRVKTGKFADWKKEVQQFSDYFNLPGVDVKNMEAAEAFNAISNELALRSRKLGEGMVLSGQTSDRDLSFLLNMNPQLITSSGGNKLIIRIRGKLLERELKVAEMAEEYKKAHGGIFDMGGFEKYVREKLSDDSIFGIPPEAKYIGKEDSKTGLPIYEIDGKFFIPEI